MRGEQSLYELLWTKTEQSRFYRDLIKLQEIWGIVSDLFLNGDNSMFAINCILNA